MIGNDDLFVGLPHMLPVEPFAVAVALDAGRLMGQRCAEARARRFSVHDEDFREAVRAALAVLAAHGIREIPDATPRPLLGRAAQPEADPSMIPGVSPRLDAADRVKIDAFHRRTSSFAPERDA